MSAAVTPAMGVDVMKQRMEQALMDVSDRFFLFASDRDPQAVEYATGKHFSKGSFKALDLEIPDVQVGTHANGSPRYMDAQDFWWEHKGYPKRVVTAMTFEPLPHVGADGKQIEDDRMSPTYNMWFRLREGMVKPDLSATSADIEPFTRFLGRLAGGARDEGGVGLKALLCWTASLYLRPHIKILHVPVLHSPEEGVGKSAFIELLRAMLGSGLVNSVEGAALKSKFQSSLWPYLVVGVNEVSAVRDPDTAGRLKTLITDPFMRIEVKQVTAHDNVPNYLQFVYTSNDLNCVALSGIGERRHLILACDETPMTPADYRAIVGWMQNGGAAKVAGVLVKTFGYDGKGFESIGWDAKARPPVTDAKLDMFEESMSPLAKFIKAKIDRREKPFEKDLGDIDDLVQILSLDSQAVLAAQKLTVNKDTLPPALRQAGVTHIRTSRVKGYAHWCWRNAAEWGKKTPQERRDHAARPGASLHAIEGGKQP
ncbi:hypothetical protein E8F11_22835 [Pseudomonas sp. BN417]|uniref:primase-helicase family protein n=1 Tax=Pseudomonas sp. BN417 TaxID=2567890 RepID=UPI0024589518|nr:DUF5906 domain-containing protein [Pseudomonas sp. BN417]MDH4557975.1 hypothetical protein [Pseudomonas sp. BN417]